MKCPYQTKRIHKPERIKAGMRLFAEDTTEFCECIGIECPFYYMSLEPKTHETIGHCRRAESEK